MSDSNESDKNDLTADQFITKGQLQEWLGLKNSQRLGFHDRGLPYIRVGLVTLYHVPSVCRWLKQQETRVA